MFQVAGSLVFRKHFFVNHVGFELTQQALQDIYIIPFNCSGNTAIALYVDMWALAA